MKKKILIFSGFFLILLTAFYFFLFSGTDYYKVKLPIMSYVQDFSFTNQNDKPVSEHTVGGKVYVANYFFTTCKGICPRMNANLAQIFKKYENDSDFAIISHTSMPETDSVPLLKAYETKMVCKDPNFAAKWYFVTGTKDSLYKMARESYLLDNPNNGNQDFKDHFIHTQFLALVDKNLRVRGIYDGLKPEELSRLSKDIATLLKEPAQQGAFNHSTFANNPD
ncbi:MAG: SCO family protein [Bacteroidota bacterium]|nr:SCO family protein [Bacteroidota bacterium]